MHGATHGACGSRTIRVTFALCWPVSGSSSRTGPLPGASGRSLRNFSLAWRLHGRINPSVVLTTGAATAVPFAWVGRLRGAKVVYVESLSRIDEPSLSLRLIAPVADRIYVQWPDLVGRVRRARYVGTVLGDL